MGSELNAERRGSRLLCPVHIHNAVLESPLNAVVSGPVHTKLRVERLSYAEVGSVTDFHELWTIWVLGFDSRCGLGIFLLTTAYRTALRPTQPPIQWVLGALSLGVKRPGREADQSPPSNAEVKEYVELYIHSHNTPSWRGA
jgi:hypothetical protein